MAVEITPEIAKKDLEKIMGRISTIGEGSTQDMAAQLILQTVGVLSRRLDDSFTLKLCYLDAEDAKEWIPGIVYDVASKLVAGEINQDRAYELLTEAEKQYTQIFKDAGLDPTRPSVIGMF